MSLPVNHPNIQAEFRAVKFVVHKTSNTCSAIHSTTELPRSIRGFAKLNKFQKSNNKLDRAQPTHPPTPLSNFFGKTVSDTARTLKSLFITYADRVHHITLIPHEYSIHTLEII